MIVYFTWEGPPGQHRFEGLWKNPSGRVTMTSEFDYKSEQRRFGGYFKMLPGDTPATGVWTYSLWDLTLAGLQRGIYRIDVLLDGDFVWRSFFRMVE